MKDIISGDYVFEKERIELHCDKIIEIIRLHGKELVFKNEKGKKFKEKIIKHARDIKYILECKLDDFFKKDLKYESLKEISKSYVFVHHLDKNPDDLPEDDEIVVLIYKNNNSDFIHQEVATYKKDDNLFYTDEITIINPDAKLLAWHKTIKI